MAPLEIRTFPGADGGMDLVSPIHMLADSKARWIIDGLVDRAGLVRQRGKLKAGSQKDTKSPYGFMASYSPDMVLRLGAFVSDDATSNTIQFFDQDNTALGSYNVGGNFSLFGEAPTFWYTKPILNKAGQVVSFALDPYTWNLNRGLGFWRGGTKANYSTGTITSTQGSATVTGSGTTWSTNVTPGMFLMSDLGGGQYRFLGVVSVIGSNTTLTLEEKCLFTEGPAANYVLTSVRGLNPRIGVGRITCATSSSTVNGTGTKFQNLAGGNTWALFKQRDMSFIGYINTINSDTQVVLSANASVACDNDKYVGIQVSHDYTFLTNTWRHGTIPAVFWGRQFYANGTFNTVANATDNAMLSRLWFSDIDDPEVFDLTNDGWNIDIPSTNSTPTPILALHALEDQLLIFKETEVWTLKGSPDDTTTWTVTRLCANGILGPNAVQGYKNGVIWPSEEGIFMFDGTELKNLTADSLGDFWIKSSSLLSPRSSRMWAMTERDHYFLHIQGWSMQYGYFKGSTEIKPTALCFCINLESGAVTLLNNIGIRGEIQLSAAGSQEATTRYLVKKGTDGSTYIATAKTLFFDEGTGAIAGGVDDFTCAGGHNLGPDFYLESARYDMDDPQIRKLWKQVQIWYNSDTLPLHLDVVMNFDTNGVTTSSALAASAEWINKRLKFLKRGQLLGFRLYSRAVGNFTPSGIVEIGPWAIGFKRQRAGRV